MASSARLRTAEQPCAALLPVSPWATSLGAGSKCLSSKASAGSQKRDCAAAFRAHWRRSTKLDRIGQHGQQLALRHRRGDGWQQAGQLLEEGVLRGGAGGSTAGWHHTHSTGLHTLVAARVQKVVADDDASCLAPAMLFTAEQNTDSADCLAAAALPSRRTFSMLSLSARFSRKLVASASLFFSTPASSSCLGLSRRAGCEDSRRW